MNKLFIKIKQWLRKRKAKRESKREVSNLIKKGE